MSAPEYRKKKYPGGDKERIKRVQSTKYRYLAMYARIAKVEASGDDGTMAVEFTYKADGGAGREKKDTDGFKLRRVAGRWLFASQ